MNAKQIANRIEDLRFDTFHPATDAGLSSTGMCAAASILQRALEEARKNAAGYRLIYKWGLGLAIDALRGYQDLWCGKVA